MAQGEQDSALGTLHHITNHRKLPCVSCCISPSQDSGSAGMRVNETTSRCSGPTQVVLGTTCLFHMCFSHFQALPLFPPFCFPSCTIHLLSYISLMLVQHPTALPISPRRRDLYLDSHGRSRGSGGGRPPWAEPTPQKPSSCCPSHHGRK